MAEAGGPDLTGRQLGSYRLEAPLGDGAFGRVYRGRHVALDIPRAIKVMQAGIALDPRFRERFLREARISAQLHHPNIVSVFDFGTEGDVQYLVMEYVRSTTLAERLGRMPVAGRLGDGVVRRWVRDVAAGLDHAHAAGVVHRDLKPANVLIRARDDRATMTDFGIAQARSDPRLTMTGQSVGTYAYMSPEQCEGSQELTSACDIYAFAAMLYEVATGEPPYGRGISAVAGHIEKPMPVERLAAADLPSGLAAVLAKGLAKAPGHRYATASELADAVLEAIPERSRARGGDRLPAGDEADRTVLVAAPAWTAPPEPPAADEPAARAPSRRLPGRRVTAAAAAAVAVLGLAVVVTAVRVAHTAPSPRPTPPASLPTPVRGGVGAPIPVAGLLLTVQSVDLGAVPPASPRLPPSDRFVTVGVQCEGDGSGPAVVSPYDWVLTDASGAVYGPVVDGLSGSLPERQLAPSDTARGRIGFVVPRSAQGLVLNYDAEQGDASAQVPLG